MFTDLVGYTSLSSRDEAAALAALEKYRVRLNSLFPKHGGRVVKTMGDGLLVEFASAVEAVNCAVELQEEMRSLNASLQESQRMAARTPSGFFPSSMSRRRSRIRRYSWDIPTRTPWSLSSILMDW
jgi:class 3 adenylate cyclase